MTLIFLCFLKNKHELVVILNKSRHLPTGRLHAVFKSSNYNNRDNSQEPTGISRTQAESSEISLKKLKKKKVVNVPAQLDICDNPFST